MCFFCVIKGKCGDLVDLDFIIVYLLCICMCIMGDNDDEIVRLC